MATPLFVIGPMRNGTTIVQAIVHRGEAVNRAIHIPWSRWEFLAIMELGGNVERRPMLDGMAQFLIAPADQYRYRLIRWALPLAQASFAWWRLLDLYPGAKFVLVMRNWYDAYLSVCKMPHIAETIGHKPHKLLYQMWHNGLRLQFQQYITSHPRRVVPVDYDRLVTDADTAMVPVWRMLDVDPPSNLQKMIRQPVHWQEPE